MKKFLDILTLKLTKQGLKEALNLLEEKQKEKIEYALEEGFEGRFLNLEKPVQFYSVYSIFSDDRENLIEKIKKENKIETEWGEVYPTVFLLPLALMSKDIEIMQEGGFEFRERIENILKEKGIKVDNPDEFLSKENQAKTLKVLTEEVEKGNLTIDEVFWYFLLVYIAGGYSALRYREKQMEVSKDG